MDMLSQGINVLLFLGLGALVYTMAFFAFRFVYPLSRKWYLLGLLFFGIVMLDNITAVGWAIVDHYKGIFHFNWWSGLQWFSFTDVTNTAPPGHPEGPAVLKILFDGLWSQSAAALAGVYLWWVAQAAVLTFLFERAYRWLTPRLR